MDRIGACGASDAGSIPAEGTNLQGAVNCFTASKFVRRSIIFSAEKIARRGRENFERRREIIRDQIEQIKKAFNI